MTATYEPDTPLSPEQAAVVARFGLDQPEGDFDRLSDAGSRFVEAVEEVLDAANAARAEVSRLRLALKEAQKR